jgi:hypothetical protein
MWLALGGDAILIVGVITVRVVTIIDGFRMEKLIIHCAPRSMIEMIKESLCSKPYM